jgi:tRNA uridine 5-carboxymethylaminomethyl modification enzyme
MQHGEIQCHMTHTNADTHRIVTDNFHLMPTISEVGMSGVGPRYCPSIDRKLQMFPDKESHNIWLEPEGIDSDIVYPNGISTALPLDI